MIEVNNLGVFRTLDSAMIGERMVKKKWSYRYHGPQGSIHKIHS